MTKYKFQSLFLEKVFYSIGSNSCKLKHDPFSYLFGKFSVSKKESNELNVNFPINLSECFAGELGRGFLKLNNNDGWEQLNYKDLQKFWTKKLSHEDTLIIIRKLIELLRPPKRFKVNALVLFWWKVFYTLSRIKIFNNWINISSFIRKLSLLDLAIKEEGVADPDNIGFVYEWTFVEDKTLDQALPPHTDGGRKLLSLLLPMTIEDNNINGTSIYSADKSLISFDSSRGKRELFTEEFRAKHLIGTYISFPKGMNTWHGVEPSKSNITRKTLILNVYRSENQFRISII